MSEEPPKSIEGEYMVLHSENVETPGFDRVGHERLTRGIQPTHKFTNATGAAPVTPVSHSRVRRCATPMSIAAPRTRVLTFTPASTEPRLFHAWCCVSTPSVVPANGTRERCRPR